MPAIANDTEPTNNTPQDLWGVLADLMEPVEGVDLTEPLGDAWAAEND